MNVNRPFLEFSTKVLNIVSLNTSGKIDKDMALFLIEKELCELEKFLKK